MEKTVMEKSRPGFLKASPGRVVIWAALFFFFTSVFALPWSNAAKTGKSSGSKRKFSGLKSFDRDDWPHWVDSDGDGQDTRAEILIRDNSGELKFKRNEGNHVTWGKWVCPYTGRTIFKASELDVDHVVPLAHAHFSGGWAWDEFRRRRFANDPSNLLAVEAEANREKGAQAPHEWRPAQKSFWPEYARIWRLVKKKYLLKISPEEEVALQEMENWKPQSGPAPPQETPESILERLEKGLAAGAEVAGLWTHIRQLNESGALKKWKYLGVVVDLGEKSRKTKGLNITLDGKALLDPLRVNRVYDGGNRKYLVEARKENGKVYFSKNVFLKAGKIGVIGLP